MKNKKQVGKTKNEKAYSYDEFMKEFYPNQDKRSKRVEQTAKEFGKVLADDAVRTIREHLSHR